MSNILNSEDFGLKIYNRFPPKYREDDVGQNFALKRYLQALSELKRKAEEAQKNLESLCSEYNALAVDGVAYLDYRKTIY